MSKKVLHFIRKNSQLKSSFIQNQIVNHIDFEPTVIFRETRDKEYDGGFAENISRDIPLINLGEDETPFERRLFRIFKQLSRRQKQKLLDIVTGMNPDILHFHYGTDAAIFLKSLQPLEIPKVVSFYGYDSSSFLKRFFGLGKIHLQKHVYPYADMVFAMSPDMKNDIVASGCPGEKVLLHYYGTDVWRFRQEHDYINHEGCRFLIISGLVPQKGHMFILKAISRARQINKRISLTIVGEGPLRDDIETFVRQNELSRVVAIPGPVVYGSNAHQRYFSEHDVFIHPSVTDVNGDKEGIPGAIVEAMAAGLPVISTRHAGIPYIISNEQTGLLVDEWDIDALEKAMLRLAESSDLRKRIGLEAQKHALANLDLKKKEIELERIYTELLQDRA